MIDYVFDHWVKVLVGLAVVGVLATAGWVVILRSTATDVTFRVSSKTYHAGSGSSSGQYLVFTNRGVFSDADSLEFWKFNSSDIYGQLRDGHTYTCQVSGWRVPFLSWYRNINTCRSTS